MRVLAGNIWQFKTDPQEIGVAQNWATSTDKTGWSEISSYVPNKGWESQGFAEYQGYAWYRQNFTIPANFERRKHLWLFFGAVDAESEIYLNGEKIFEHTFASTGLTPETIWNEAFFVDIAPKLKIGENTLAVRVTSSGGLRGVWRPATLVSSDTALTADAFRTLGGDAAPAVLGLEETKLSFAPQSVVAWEIRW